jgi:hypothetical protein
LFCLSLVLPKPSVLDLNLCFCWKKNDIVDEYEEDVKEEKEVQHDTSDEEQFEDESVIDVFSKDSDSEPWTVEEEVTVRGPRSDRELKTAPSPPNISPTSALTTPSAVFSEEEEEDSPIDPPPTTSSPRVRSILDSSPPPPTSPTATAEQGQECTSNEQGTDILDMWCGDPLQVDSFLNGQGVKKNLQALSEAVTPTVVQDEKTEETA